jgi:hypothetical protein
MSHPLTPDPPPAPAAHSPYRGWLRISVSPPPDQPPLPADAPPQPIAVTLHLNTIDATTAHVREFADDVDISFHCPASRRRLSYARKDHRIHINSLSDQDLESLPEGLFPTTVDGHLARMKASLQRDPSSVKQSADGDTTRHDIAFPDAPCDEGGAACRGCIPTRLTLWTDARGLIVRMRHESPIGPIEMTITYDTPAIRDIHDLGVPRDTPVIDNTIPKNLETLLASIHRRAADAFPNSTALLITYALGPDGQPSPAFGFATLFARKSDQWLIFNYRLLAPPNDRLNVPLLLQPPANWPAPDIHALLPLLETGTPIDFKVFDGVRGRSGRYRGESGTYDHSSFEKGHAQHMLLAIGLADSLWPTSACTRFGFTGTHVAFHSDPRHPYLVGIRSTTTRRRSHTSTEQTLEQSTWWLDPARDHLAVEAHHTTDNGHPWSEHTHFDQFTQLPDGHWYPAHWQARRSHTGVNPPSDSTIHYHVQIDPALRLPDSRFQAPAAAPHP